MLVFMEGGKPENPEKNPRNKDNNQQQTQPTYDTGTGTRPFNYLPQAGSQAVLLLNFTEEP